MWMSEARSRSAWVMIIWTTRTTGASSLTWAVSSWSASRRRLSRASNAWTWLPTSPVAL